ncbi:spermatogenesis-associated serine-rich protein 2 [Oncorhynchus kisutch]|uniref:Spermatosis associated serine rich 2 n=1 Tax=Oncorhynchus kisutch TaxID=8019 RepID=A0A8C7J1G0_ONCKI|nr:spermatogenesis-associated serine-rich protein 2 [Oncorhynchus kisutch]XP_020314759.1 spermatogenesis-associated serine-rich protein 2 [Oncorhynchus kisutch]
MAKKNSQKDTSGMVFDTNLKMVMSQGGTFERMKEKISAVRAVVPNKSNNEIVLVLQHFENCVDKAVQAFLEGSAVEILKEWNVTGKKKPKKKKKPKPQPEPEPLAEEPALAETMQPSETESKEAVNGFHANGSVLDGDSLDSLSEQLDSASLDAAELDSEPATSDITGAEADSLCSGPSPTPHHAQGGRNHQPPRGNKFRSRTNSQPSTSSVLTTDENQQGSSGAKKIAPNIDRSVKDLQRCTVSLTRYRVVVKDEMDSSIKTMKQTFAELQSCLMDREVTLLTEMDKVKAEAMAILDGRQKRAEELRRLTDQSASMSEDQLSELRADIKHFVSERKFDEDLGKAVKFTFELEPLKTSITGFGSVYHPQTGYSSRSRCSSTTSSITGPGSVETPPPSSYEGRPTQPNKTTFLGNRRYTAGPGYHSGGQRYNGGSYRDRNPNRGGYRSQGYQGQGDGPSHPTATQSSNSTRAPSNSAPSSSYRQDHPSHNGLPQRPPRTHCP